MPQTPTKPVPASVAAKAKTFDTFHLHPFAVAKTNGANEWTAEDGRSPEVIRQLAHNELEAERMTNENSQIKRRQLVYRKEPITKTIEQARAAGEPVQSFTLPGLDGKEYDVEVTQNYVQTERMEGALAGRIKGRFNSMASIGFKNGYESYSIISPDDGVYIVADAREPGEVMVKEIDPTKYALPSQTSAPDFILTK